MSIEEAADAVASSEFVRVVARADADGVASAACVCSALSSLSIPYHFTVEDPSDAVYESADVFCGLGARYLGSIGDAVVIDNRPPSGADGFEGVLVGTEFPSSSVASHRVASRTSSGDPVAALVGAVGDGVSVSENEVSEVIEEAIEAGAKKQEGARLADENPAEALAYSIRPFTRLSGDYEAAREFVEEAKDLPTAVVLLALTQEEARADAVAELAGDVYRLPSGIDIHTLSRYVEACAVSGKHGLALSLCLDPGAHLEEARETWRAFNSTVIEKVRGAEIEEGDDEPCFAHIRGSFDTGAVADTLYDWVTGDVVVVNQDGEASVRADTFDCGHLAREVASSVGGEGRWKRSRARVFFPASDVSQDEFVEAVRRTL